MVDSSNDWQCPNTNCVNNTKMVFGSKDRCPKCGSAKGGGQMQQHNHAYSMGNMGPPMQQQLGAGAYAPAAPGNGPCKGEKGMQGGDLPDDWQCPNQTCINHTKLVFAKRSSCPSCGTARNAKQPGDWQCPNPSCLNHQNTVFASKASCPKCGSPRMGSYSLMQMAGVPAQGYGMNGGGAMQQPRPNMAMGMGGTANPGDWQCPNGDCINNRKYVFAKHANCPKCGAAKGPNVGNFLGNPGDWQCPNGECLNHRNKVFAKHANCPACGTEKPGDFAGRTGRSRSPYRGGLTI